MITPSHSPGVTVVIAAWRAEGTIGRAVASALAQPDAAEVVVVDDASGDDGATLAAARAADDGTGRLTVLAQARNAGPSAARNVAIATSKADWIAILDSDDFMEPGRLAKLLALSNAGYDLIADDLLQTPEGQPVSAGKVLWFRTDQNPVDVSFGMFIDSNITKASRMRRELGFLKPLVRRAFLDTHGLTYDETMRLGEDYDLYARALSLGAKMRLIPWTGYVSVMRGNSLSLNHGRTELAALEACDDRLLASGRLSPADARLVEQHRFSTRSRIVWIDFMAALKGGKPFHALSVILKDMRQLPYVMRGIVRMVASRFGGAQKT
ncbi:MAG: glycosyltransferase family 2 protein [Hyphomonadaceae bacterium]